MGLQQTLKALADPIRREILNMLKKGRMSAGRDYQPFLCNSTFDFKTSIGVEGC